MKQSIPNPRTLQRISSSVLESPLLVTNPCGAIVLLLDLLERHGRHLLGPPAVDGDDEDAEGDVADKGEDGQAETEVEGGLIGGTVFGEEYLLR